MLLIHILSYVFLIIRPPLSSTRNETLIPCTTVFRSRSDREDPEAVRALSRTRSADARRRRQRAGRPHPPPAVRAFARRYQLLRTARRLPFRAGQAPAGRHRGIDREYRLPDRLFRAEHLLSRVQTLVEHDTGAISRAEARTPTEIGRAHV